MLRRDSSTRILADGSARVGKRNPNRMACMVNSLSVMTAPGARVNTLFYIRTVKGNGVPCDPDVFEVSANLLSLISFQRRNPKAGQLYLVAPQREHFVGIP